MVTSNKNQNDNNDKFLKQWKEYDHIYLVLCSSKNEYTCIWTLSELPK